MKTQRILGVPVKYFFVTVAVLIIGIIIGSFADYDINVALANKTKLGAFFATYGSYFSYCLYPAAGMCLFVGLKKKNKAFAPTAWVVLCAAYFLAVYYSNSYNGSKVRELFGYCAGSSPAWMCLLSWGFWAVLYAWVPPVLYRLLDDSDAQKLLVVGLTVLVAGILADNVNLWLKQVSSRPRFKYLLTLEDPLSEYRSWWQMVPHLAGSNDNFKSWPSGNMTIASMMFALPMFSEALKTKSKARNAFCFVLACVFVGIYGYNRIHMTNHYLTDVCFGTLITYGIFALIHWAFQKLEGKPENTL